MSFRSFSSSASLNWSGLSIKFLKSRTMGLVCRNLGDLMNSVSMEASRIGSMGVLLLLWRRGVAVLESRGVKGVEVVVVVTGVDS